MAKKYLDNNGLLYFWQKIKNTFALASHSHTKSEITDFPSSMTPSSHTHGNITNAGALQTTDVAIANGDKLVITDSSNSNKVARASLSFDGSTTTKALTQKGTFETFLTAADVPEGASASTTTPKMDGTAAVGTETAFARGDHVHPSDTSRAPVSHATTATTYGKGTSSNYGHVKLSDSTTATTAAASGGTAATPKAVSDALAAAKTYADGLDTGVSNVTVDGISVVTNGVATVDLSGKVDKVTGKGLSTEDYTSAEKTKLSGISAEANKVIVGLQSGVVGFTIDGTASNAMAIATTQKGSASGICPLDANSKVDAQYLPSYVDDVLEAYPRSGQTELSQNWLSATSGGSALTPETGKIYVLMADSTNYAANTQFRWSGSAYVKLADGGVSEITNAEIDTIVAS